MMTSHPLIRLLDRGAVLFLAILAAFAVLIPVLNLLMPVDSALHLPTYFVALFGK